jgi:hypothetical protein
VETFRIDKLESEIALINEILDKTALKDGYRSRQIIMNMRLDREIEKINLENKLRFLND